MAITKLQQPNNFHSVFLNTENNTENFYTYKTDETNIDKFYYKYNINTIDGIIFTGITVPLENTISYNISNEILKNKTSFNFNPSIDTIESVPNNKVIYYETVQEQEYSSSAVTFDIRTAGRWNDRDFNYNNYLLPDSQANFLAKNLLEHNVRVEDEFTFRTFNGYIELYDRSIDTMILTLYLEEEDSATGANALVFSYYNVNTYTGWVQPTIAAMQTGDENGIEIPAGIKNWNENDFNYNGYITSSGYEGFSGFDRRKLIINDDRTFTTDTWDGVPAITGTVKYYELAAGTPIVGAAPKIQSLVHKFNVVEDCRFDSINVAWENEESGVSYFLFEKANEKTIASKKSVYDINTNILNLTSETVDTIPYDRRTTVYNNISSTMIETNTNWLNQTEIDYLEDLFKSTEVYIKYKGQWKYVINSTKKAVIYNKKRKGLKKYKINFQLSNKNIKY